MSSCQRRRKPLLPVPACIPWIFGALRSCLAFDRHELRLTSVERAAVGCGRVIQHTANSPNAIFQKIASADGRLG